MAKTGSYGIKEVADVKFYEVGTVISNPTVTSGVISYTAKKDNETATAKYTFDSLKVSNIEVTSEETSARGGKGNPELISWSYGKSATLTIEDALINMETLDLMFGGSETDVSTTVTVDANSFPGAYCIVGVTVMRSYDDGKDYPFLFVIPKGQAQANGTLSMTADGDPSTFEMTIKALSATYGNQGDVLMQFQKVATAVE